MRGNRTWFRIVGIALSGLLAFTASFRIRANDNMPEEYRRFIVHQVDSRSTLERLLNAINLTTNDVGRSFALIAGVSRYPKLTGSQRALEPAEQDLRKLVVYLKEVEFFDEIIVLRNEDMTFNNLRYFLQVYIPDRLKSTKNSRFLFAYSGHGIHDGFNSYILESGAHSMSDKAHAIDLKQLRAFFPQIVANGHHVLVLLNACYSGAFLQRKFGGKDQVVPKLPGAHAITAGGSNELTWHDPAVGSGSVFFEKFFSGTDGIADTYPVNANGTRGDGIVTVSELAAYLEQEIMFQSDQKQNPQAGDISLHGGEGGGFFFLSRRVQVSRKNIPKIDFSKSFGEETVVAPLEKQTPTRQDPEPPATAGVATSQGQADAVKDLRIINKSCHKLNDGAGRKFSLKVRVSGPVGAFVSSGWGGLPSNSSGLGDMYYGCGDWAFGSMALQCTRKQGQPRTTTIEYSGVFQRAYVPVFAQLTVVDDAGIREIEEKICW